MFFPSKFVEDADISFGHNTIIFRNLRKLSKRSHKLPSFNVTAKSTVTSLTFVSSARLSLTISDRSI